MVHSWENMFERSSHGKDYTGADMRHCNATGGSFTTCQMFNANFHRSTFRKTDFSDSLMFGAIMTKAVFENCRMYLTNLSHSDCQGTSFRGSYLRKANFRKANLRGTDFTGVHIDGTIFAGANITGAVMDDKTRRYAMANGAVDDNNSTGPSVMDSVLNDLSSLAASYYNRPRLHQEPETTNDLGRKTHADISVKYKEAGRVLVLKNFIQRLLDVDRLLAGRK